MIPKRNGRYTAGSHQQRTTGKAEERCDKSELAVQGSALVLLKPFIRAQACFTVEEVNGVFL